MNESQFTMKCNLKGIKVSWIRDYVTFNGKKFDLLVCTKKDEWAVNLLTNPAEVEKDPEGTFKRAWDIVARTIKENAKKPFRADDQDRINTLWEEACKEMFAKEGKHGRRNAGRTRSGASGRKGKNV